MRPSLRLLLCALSVFWSALSIGGVSHAQEEAPPAAERETPPAAPAGHQEVKARALPELESLLRIGHTKLAESDFVSAEIAFGQVVTAGASREQRQTALLGLARTYRQRGDFTKAVAVYESWIQDFSDDRRAPMVYLELGRTHRALGAYRLAIARFYSVIHFTLKLPDADPQQYRQLARTAQFEIAETHLLNGRYEEAARLFARFHLLDLAPADRARAQFKAAVALRLAGKNDAAVTALQAFVKDQPADDHAAEARSLLAITLRDLGRHQEALHVTLDLLRQEHPARERDPQRWAHWQRQTGNQLANAFYEQGDITAALAIYQRLLALAEEPSWRLPVLYQIGLCHERLRQWTEARQSYQSIGAMPETVRASRPDLADLAAMAAWRLQQLEQQEKTEQRIFQLFSS